MLHSIERDALLALCVDYRRDDSEGNQLIITHPNSRLHVEQTERLGWLFFAAESPAAQRLQEARKPNTLHKSLVLSLQMSGFCSRQSGNHRNSQRRISTCSNAEFSVTKSKPLRTRTRFPDGYFRMHCNGFSRGSTARTTAHLRCVNGVHVQTLDIG